jgi:hypothetical protein
MTFPVRRTSRNIPATTDEQPARENPPSLPPKGGRGDGAGGFPAPSKKEGCDRRCYELANFFLEDAGLASSEVVAALTEELQDTIEAFIAEYQYQGEEPE